MTTRAKPAGLAAYVAALDPETHDRITDAILAERCWRDLDKDLPAKNTALYQRALAQIDKPITRGMALILKDRFGKIAGAPADVQKAQLAFVAQLGLFLDRAARAANPARADELKAQWSLVDPTKVDAKKARDAIDALFPCP